MQIYWFFIPSVYTEVDGRELESSAIVFDLRFIPDDMTFDEQPVSSCTSLPDETTFKPKEITKNV